MRKGDMARLYLKNHKKLCRVAELATRGRAAIHGGGITSRTDRNYK